MSTETTMNDTGNREAVAGNFLCDVTLRFTRPRNVLTEKRAEVLLDNLLCFDDDEKVRQMIELLEGFKGLIQSNSPRDLGALYNICDNAVRRAFVYTTYFQIVGD